MQRWKLETQVEANGNKYHTSESGVEYWQPAWHLGSGSYGHVWLEECVTSSRKALRAVKQINKVPTSSKLMQRELAALIAFSDTNVPEVCCIEVQSRFEYTTVADL